MTHGAQTGTTGWQRCFQLCPTPLPAWLGSVLFPVLSELACRLRTFYGRQQLTSLPVGSASCVLE